MAYMLRQMLQGWSLLAHPEKPVIMCAPDQVFRSSFFDQIIQAPDLPLAGSHILYGDHPEVDILMKIYRIPAAQEETEIFMIQADLGDQGIGEGTQIPFPAWPHPGKLIIHPNPQAGRMTSDVVFLPHVRVVKVAKAIILIKAHQEPAVTNWDVSRHRDRAFPFRMTQTRNSILV